MEKEERIQLRDQIINQFKQLSILISVNNKYYKINSKKKLVKELQGNNQLQRKYNLYIEQFRSEEEAIYCILHEDDFENHLCPNCNNICSFYNLKHPYHKSCGNSECITKYIKSDKVKDKRKKTNLERYGVSTPFKSKEIQKKIKEINLEKYGAQNPFASKIIKNKIKETNLEKYGVENAFQNKEIQEKAKETNLEKYGVENIFQLQEIKDKIKQINLERYNVEYPMQSREIQEKAKKTNIEKYGVEHPIQSKEIQEKMKETNLKIYNVEYASQSKEFQDKVKETCLMKYNVEYPMQSKEIKEKSKQTCLKKYNVEYAIQSKEIQEKIKQGNLQKYGVENLSQLDSIKEKKRKTSLKHYGVESFVQKNIKNYDIWINDNKFKQFIIDKYNKLSFLTLMDICIEFNVSFNSAKNKIEELDLLDYFYIQDSNLEIDFDKFLNENNIQHIRHYRKIFIPNTKSRREIDFLCNGNIGFEINDINSHNSLNNNIKDKYYHRDKTILANNYNIRLIHIWEWELRNNNEWGTLNKWIINLFNNKIKIGARKTIIKEIPKNIEKEFLNEYHLQGYKKSIKCYGLYYNKELIQIMSFTKSRYNKNYQWELLRLCTKYGYMIIGGAQKLLKKFIKENNPESIISYCNLDKFDGIIYKNLGFQLLKKMEPQIIWCNKEMKHFTQSSLNMIGADKLLNVNYGKGTDNEEIVIERGYVPIYNCGLAVYTLRLENKNE